MLSLIKNIAKSLLGKNNLPNSPFYLQQFYENFYQHTDLFLAQWVSIAVNKKEIAESLLTKELEILTPQNAYSLKIADLKTNHQHQLWKNSLPMCKVIAENNSPLMGEYNQLIDKLFENEIRYFQTQLNQPLENPHFKEAEIAADEKALEWMKVSFKVLENAIIESYINSEFLFQTLVFMGKNPKTNLREIRLITFNLDIIFKILPNGTLRIQIFNDKNGELGSTKKAALEGDFNYRKREMLDQLTKLISVLASGIKLPQNIQ